MKTRKLALGPLLLGVVAAGIAACATQTGGIPADGNGGPDSNTGGNVGSPNAGSTGTYVAGATGVGVAEGSPKVDVTRARIAVGSTMLTSWP